MRTSHALLACAVLTLAAVVYALVVYPHLPATVPTHWNLHGQVDGWMPRFWGVAIMPIVMAALTACVVVFPWLSPKGWKVDDFRDTFNYVMVLVVALMGFAQTTIVYAGLHPGAGGDVGRTIITGMFVFFALLGNVIGKVKRNFWMGIRTPWTLANDTVWYATHRFAGRLMFGAGLLGAIASALGLSPVACFVLLFVALLIPVPYSLFLYKRLEAEGKG